MRGLTSAIVSMLIWTFVAPPSLAQNAPAAMTHYRAYREALARGDLAGAEVAAAAAAAASEEADGDGGQTPALLLNLARIRVQQGKWQQASEPAKRAYERARTGGTGVDPLMSELLLARVRLELEGFPAAQSMQALLDRAGSREDLLGDRYDAAEQLGIWAQQRKSHLMARRAWASAADAARGAAIDANFAKGRARAQEAVAIVMQSLARDLTVSPTTARQARERLVEAHALIRPFAFTSLPDGRLSAPQALYAQILAWDAALWSKVMSDQGGRGLARLDANPSSLNGAPLCGLSEREGDRPPYPATLAFNGELGAVVLRLRFGEQGDYQGVDVAASVGDEGFARAVSTAASTWSFKLDSRPDCRASPIIYSAVVFAFRN